MSVKRAMALALVATACRDASSRRVEATLEPQPPAHVSEAVTPARAIAKLPPPPPEQRAELIVAAPSAARLLPRCDDVRLRIYADGTRRSCMTGGADRGAQVFASCGQRAELPAEQPVQLEVRYERRGIVLATIDLGERTLDIGKQSLDARGAVSYGDIDRQCPQR